MEAHLYGSGRAGETPTHAHAEYQICLSLNFPGEYRYRGASHRVPTGSLSIIHPGEVHTSRDPFDRPAATAYRLLYVPPELIGRVAGELSRRHAHLPFFADPIVLDAALAGNLLAIHRASRRPAARLGADSLLLAFLSRLVQRGGVPARTLPPAREHRAVRLARAYLEERFDLPVSLSQLAEVAGLSPFYLTRVFRAQVGMPPHAYQLAVRIGRARKLLAQGCRPAQVAAETGFADQAHLSRHFRRFVGTPPGHYRG